MPRGEQLLNRSKSFAKNEETVPPQDHPPSDPEEEVEQEDSDHVMVAGSHVIVIQLLKSGFINNPVIVSEATCYLTINNERDHCSKSNKFSFFFQPNHNHLLLHSADQVYLGPPSVPAHPSNEQKGWRSNGYYGNDNNAISGLGKAEGIVPQWNIIPVHVHNYYTGCKS